jgi:proline iminopeptidase
LHYPHSILSYISICGTGIQNDRDWKRVYVDTKEGIGEEMPHFDFPYNKIVHRSLMIKWRNFIKEPDLLNRIAELSLPSLFITAENDIRPPWPSQQISSLIKGAQYLTIADAEHYIWLTKKEELGLKGYIKELNDH